MPKHLKQLDGIRGVAILLVVCYRFRRFVLDYPDPLSRTFSAIFTPGWSGVDLFFVLSGFLYNAAGVALRVMPPLGVVPIARRMQAQAA